MASPLSNLGISYRESKGRTVALRKDLESAVLAARERGETYVSIAESVGMSVAWVQAAIARAKARRQNEEIE